MDNDTIDKYLDFDNLPGLLDFRFSVDSMPMWQFIRLDILYAAIALESNIPDLYESLTIKKVITVFLKKEKIISTIKYIWLMLIDILTPYPQKKILMITSSGFSNVLHEGKHFDWLNDPYALLFPDDTLILEKSFNLRYNRPRYFRNIKLMDTIRIKAELYSKVNKAKEEDIESINRLIDFIKSRFPVRFDEEFYFNKKNELVRMSIMLEFYKKYWTKVLRKIDPRLIIVNCGCYGNYFYLFNIAHRLNIQTGELQHGMILKNAPEYNYGDKLIKDSEYSKLIPRYVFTFGDYWNQQTRVSSEMITLGSSKMNEYKAEKKQDNGKYTILFILNKVNYNAMLEIISGLEKYDLSNIEIIMRPHPGDMDNIYKYNEFAKVHSVSIDKTPSIQAGLSLVNAIVSDFSMVIYEAKHYRKDVYLYQSPISRVYNIDDHIGHKFDTAEQLYGLISVKYNSNYKELFDSGYYFDPDWRANYSNFIKNLK